MDSLQRCEVHFPGNAADVPWSAPAFPAHPYSQSAPSSHRLTVPSQPRAGLRDAEFPPVNAVGNYRDEDWHMPPPVETAVGQGLPQDLRYAEYDVINDHPPIHEHCDRAINNAGDAVDPPARAQAAPPAPDIDGHARGAAAGPARAFLDEWPPRGPLPIRQTNEVLRQLAMLYVREPNSQVALISVEPGHAHGIRVVITLELTDI